MKLYLTAALVTLCTLLLGATLAHAQPASAPLRPSEAGRIAFGCPSTFKGLNLLSADGNVGKVRQIAGQPTFAFLCRYAGQAGTAEWDARWDEGTSTSPTKCGLPDERGTTTPGVPFAYVYSQTKAAYLYAGGRVGTLDEMIAAGRAHLQEAESKAMACNKAAAPTCNPGNFSSLIFREQTSRGGVPSEVSPGGGTFSLTCHWSRDGVGGVIIRVIWYEKEKPILDSTCGKATTGTGMREEYHEYSKTHEVHFTINISPGRDINVYPFTLQQVLAVARPLVAQAEGVAVPCVGRGGAPPAAAAVTTPTRPTPAPQASAKPEAAAVLPDEAYQDPDVVGKDGLAAAVLEPGSDLPGAEQTAIAGVAIAAGAAAVGASELTRRRRNPAEAIAGDVIRARVTQVKEDEARRILRRALPRNVVDRLDDPVAALTSLAGAAVHPENLGRTIRQTLVNEPRVVEQILGRHGITPPMVAALGGPGRVVKIIERIGRNPPRAIREGLRDALHNLTHPKELVRHIGNAVKRVVEASPVGPVAGLLGRLFRPRHRRPRATPAGSQLDARQMDTTTPTQLATARPEAVREEDLYPTAPDSQPGGGP